MPLAVFCLAALTLLDRTHDRFLQPVLPETLEPLIGLSSVLEGRVESAPEIAESGFRTVVSVHGTKVLLRTGGGEPPAVERGDTVRFSAKLKRPVRYRNPGSFDYRRHLERRGIPLTAFVENPQDVTVTGKGRGGLLRAVDRLRAAIRGRYDASLSKPGAGFLTALVAGDRSGLTAEVWEDFRRTGTAHLVAISGQHIAIVAALAYAVLLWLLKRSESLMLRTSVRSLARSLALIPVVFYTLLAGSPPSAVRASLVVALLVLALWSRREVEAWSALAFAALGVAVLDPPAVFSASFQLSFLAVLGLLLFADRRARPTRTERYLLGPFWMTAGATLATAPLVAYLFHQVSLSGLVTNLWAIPAVGLLLVTATAALAFPFLNHPLDALTRGFLWALHQSSERSWVVSFYPTEIELGLCLTAVAWLAWLKRSPGLRKAALLTGLGFLPLGFGLWQWDPAKPSGDFQITFLDVGQGDAALAVTPSGRSLLIDAGGFLIPWGDSGKKSFDVGERVLVPYLKRLGLRRIDAVLMSHPHPDHFGGMAGVIRNIPVGEIWWNGQIFPDSSFEDLQGIIREKGIPERILKGGDAFDWDECRIEVLYPDRVRPLRRFNDNSLVVRLSYGGASILLPGDIEKEGEGALADRIPVRSHILKIPHHASKTSSSVPFIDSVGPQFAVASLGEGNLFGFPHEGILEKYERRSVRVFRTDRHGAVTFTIPPDFPKTPLDVRTQARPAAVSP